MPQIDIVSRGYIFQEDRASQHCAKEVRTFLNQHLSHWIDCCGPQNAVFCIWPHRPPDKTSCDAFFIGLCESLCIYASLAKAIQELKMYTLNPLVSVTTDILQNA